MCPPIRPISRRSKTGAAAPSSGCCRPASRCCAAASSRDRDDFTVLPALTAAGMTDYLAMITRFADDGIIGEMDGVYSSWATRPQGFDDRHVAALARVAPFLATAIKSVSLVRMTRTLMETYLGRDPGRRVLAGRIVRGLTEEIDAVVWFSDLAGFTRITDTTPEAVIPLLNDYSDAIVSAIHEHGGDVLKLIGDGTLAIFRPRTVRMPAKRRSPPRSRRAARSPKPKSGGRRRASRSPTCISVCMSARCSTAMSEAASGSTSPSSARR